MDESIIKFIIDLGSIGAICLIVYIFVKFISEQQERQLEEHKIFLRTIKSFSKNSEESDEE